MKEILTLFVIGLMVMALFHEDYDGRKERDDS